MSAVDHLEPDLAAAVASWERRGWPRPDVILVSGSGLGVDLGAPVAGPIPLAELLPFPIHAVAGHAHQVELLEPRPGRKVLYSRGRIHFYQGYEPAQVVFTVRLAALLGARTLLLTNASGGINPSLHPGDLTLVRDHLNLTGANPLCGHPPDTWGPRFPGLVDAYSPRLRALAQRHAGELGIALSEGVYAGLQGPSYETPAETAMLQRLGADLAGMSTVLEVIAARHLGMSCLCLSVVSNLAAGASGTKSAPPTHEEVLEAGRQASGKVAQLLGRMLGDPELTIGAAPTPSAG